MSGMDLRVTPSVAITGAASGIGAACVARLSDAGAEVITVDVHDADIVADLGTSTGRQSAVDAITGRCDGALDGLVTCAGLGPIPDRAGSRIVAVNYYGTVELLAGLRPALAAGKDATAVQSSVCRIP